VRESVKSKVEEYKKIMEKQLESPEVNYYHIASSVLLKRVKMLLKKVAINDAELEEKVILRDMKIALDNRGINIPSIWESKAV
jgi:hypothetical protein